jgi:ATP-dependent DNA helicase RecG
MAEDGCRVRKWTWRTHCLLEGEGKSFDKTVCRGLEIGRGDVERLCRKMTVTARKNAVSNEQRKAVKPVTLAQLVKWGVLVERDGELLPTWAYVLLSGNERMAPVVKCGVFKGKDRSVFVDRRQFESPLQEQVEKATQYVLEKINLGAHFNGVYREDVYEIPPDAIRELIVNAVVHRSYVDGEASPITVALYDDRLEVTSPGGLVRGMTLEKMVSGYSDCRNKAVAAAFAYMNLIENWGSGVKRYIDAIKGAGLREPEFIVWPNAVRVNVYRHKEVTTAVEPNEPNREPNEPNCEPNVLNCKRVYH